MSARVATRGSVTAIGYARYEKSLAVMKRDEATARDPRRISVSVAGPFQFADTPNSTLVVVSCSAAL